MPCLKELVQVMRKDERVFFFPTLPAIVEHGLGFGSRRWRSHIWN